MIYVVHILVKIKSFKIYLKICCNRFLCVNNVIIWLRIQILDQTTSKSNDFKSKWNIIQNSNWSKRNLTIWDQLNELDDENQQLTFKSHENPNIITLIIIKSNQQIPKNLNHENHQPILKSSGYTIIFMSLTWYNNRRSKVCLTHYNLHNSKNNKI